MIVIQILFLSSLVLPAYKIVWMAERHFLSLIICWLIGFFIDWQHFKQLNNCPPSASWEMDCFYSHIALISSFLFFKATSSMWHLCVKKKFWQYFKTLKYWFSHHLSFCINSNNLIYILWEVKRNFQEIKLEWLLLYYIILLCSIQNFSPEVLVINPIWGTWFAVLIFISEYENNWIWPILTQFSFLPGFVIP